MEPIESRLSGRQATLAAVLRAVDRQLASQALARVELRYSTQAARPLDAVRAQQAIAALLRERGLPHASISVRAHESPLDDGAGEHLLRMVPAAPSPVAAHGLWQRLWRSLFGGDEDGVQAVPMPAVRPVSSAEAVQALRAAVNVANAEGMARIGSARIVVRLPELHATLQRMVTAELGAAAQSMAGMLRAKGLACAEAFAVAYAFEPHRDGDGTAYAHESDIEVVLRPAGTAAFDATAMPRLPQATALPAAARSPAVRVRVVGTTAGDFPQAFELPLAQLPARIDRDSLRASGFGRAHAQLLAVASNSSPLTVTLGAHDRPVLNASARTGAGAAPQPMYFRARDHEPLQGEHTLPPEGLRLLVNSPSGALDPASGRLLPALVLELRAA